MAARLLDAYSAIGKELDSLADLISFGMAPAVIMYHLIIQAEPAWQLSVGGTNIVPFVAFLIVIFSALRLANFNIDTRQTNSFIGLPTPANAIFTGSLALLAQEASTKQIIMNAPLLIIVTIVFSLLLVAPIPLFSLKIKNFKLRENLFRYILIALSVLLIIIFKTTAVPLIIISYILLSVIENAIKQKV